MNNLQRNVFIGISLLLLATSPAWAEETYELDIADQELSSALKLFAEQSGLQVVYFADLANGKQTKGVQGTYSANAALAELLDNTELTYSTVDDRTYSIAAPSTAAADEAEDPGKSRPASSQVLMAQNQAPAQQTQTGQTKSDDDEDEVLRLHKISVVGTRIKGAQPTSLVVAITQEEMRHSGHNNLGEVIRALPQNFGGGQNPGVALAAFIGAGDNRNLTGSSSLNLRGLGPDATLTLLNGTRLPYDGFSQVTDVASIPTAAVERMEILLDGASVIYGSDAVGGVANIVLKRDYEGAELSARIGAATDGGYEQRQYTGVAGTNWGSGGFLITGDYSDNESVKVRQRDYLSQMAFQNITIYPESTQKGALFSGHQEIGAIATFNLDAFYTERSMEGFAQTNASSFSVDGTDSSIWGVAPTLDFALAGEWSARLHGTFGRNEAERTVAGFSTGTGLQTSETLIEYFNGMQAAGIEAEGPLFALPGADARAAIGSGWRRYKFGAEEERSHYLYGEIDLPLVSEDQNVPLMGRLSLNAAVRHENYDSFGGSTIPKMGAIWGFAPGFDLKASWGKSFKAPTLEQRHRAVSLQLRTAASRGDVSAPADAQVLVINGGSPDLTPETAEILTAGFVANPEFLPGLTLEFNYFDIDYTDRVAFPIDVSTQALSNPVFAEFVIRNPTIAQQEAAFAAAGLPVGSLTFNFADAPYDPTKVIAITDNRFTNASSQRVKGFDLTARYVAELFDGDLTLRGNGSWITEGTRKLSDLASEQPTAGFNFWPAKFKGRFGAGWSRAGFTLNANLNHITGIIDRGVTPNVKRDSMTTLDLIVDYQWISDIVGDVGFNVAVTNIFNQAPPFLTPVLGLPFVVNYDSTNYSALGRVVSATITKRF